MVAIAVGDRVRVAVAAFEPLEREGAGVRAHYSGQVEYSVAQLRGTVTRVTRGSIIVSFDAIQLYKCTQCTAVRHSSTVLNNSCY